MALSEKNPVCNTVNQSFQRKIVFLTVCLDFPQNLTAKNIQNLGLQILSVGFIFFPLIMGFHGFHRKKDLVSSFNSALFLPATRFFLPIGDLAHYLKKDLSD